MDEATIKVDLTSEELVLIREALDSHEYWQLGHDLPRNEGLVFIPGDFVDENDSYWSDGPVNRDEAIAINKIREVRTLLARLGEHPQREMAP